MDQLSPHHVPVYGTHAEQRALWEQCAERGHPVVAVRDARRGYIVRYDLQHLDAELAPAAVTRLRRRARNVRSYPTGGESGGVVADPLSEAEGVGGETGPVSGTLHARTEPQARDLASRLSAMVFDRAEWR